MCLSKPSTPKQVAAAPTPATIDPPVLESITTQKKEEEAGISGNKKTGRSSLRIDRAVSTGETVGSGLKIQG